MSGTKPRILIADDEEVLLDALSEYLGCCGYDVITARRPVEAERVIAKGDLAVVITDLRFWGSNGTQGLDIARAAREHLPSGRIFLLTAHATPEVEKEARAIGIDALLHKPIPLPELARLVIAGAGSSG